MTKGDRMETKRRKYTKEFKLSVVYELLGGMKPKEVFEKYQLDRPEMN